MVGGRKSEKKAVKSAGGKKANTALVIIGAIVVVLLVLFVSGTLNSLFQSNAFQDLASSVSREKAFEEQRRPQRDSYGIPAQVFADLPAIPEDFGTMSYMFEVGRWSDLKYFTSAYFLQPEFYPEFETAGLRWWKNPDASSWGVVGWGAYPGDIWVDTYQGANFNAITFWHAGWGVQTYQGVQLLPVYPASSQDDNGTVFNTQNPSEVSNYFSVSFDKQVFLLGPTYPKFDKDWARAVNVKVSVSPNTPKGDYVLGIDAGLPPEEMRSQWLLKYKMMYFDSASSGISINRPHFRLMISVK